MLGTGQIAGAALAGLIIPALLASPAAAAPDRSLEATVVGSPVLTLPAGDGLRDGTRIRVVSAAPGDIDLIAVRGDRTLHLADEEPLRRTADGWRRTIRVPVRQLAQGGWALRASRSDDHAVRADRIRLRVGSGVPTAVTMTPTSRTLRPLRDAVLDAAEMTVVAADETGTPVPVTGRISLEVKRSTRSRPLADGTASIPVTGLPFGTATVTGELTGPAGKPVTRSTTLTLAPTEAGPMRLAMSNDTVQPVRDDLLDTVSFTTTGAAVAASPAPVSGSLSISGPAGVVRRWSVPDGSPRTVTWDGRVGGAIMPGTYTVSLALRGPEGVTKTKVRAVTVSKDHLPYRVRDLFGIADGNQQGLAVHDDEFFVASDVGGGSRVDVYDGSGGLRRSLGVLPLGHGAELSWSTGSNLLWAANGGPAAPTWVWAVAPDTGAIQRQFDLSGLGPNGMVAVDDLSPAGPRLLVFAGTAGAFTVSDVSMDDGSIRSTVPIVIDGIPQGVEVVNGELWVYTSLRGRNRLARYALTGGGASSAFDLMNTGEGQGLGVAAGGLVVGAHGPNRIGLLELVPDE